MNAKLGSALLSVMVIIFTMSMVAGSIYTYSVHSAHHSKRSTELIKSYNLAETGLHHALSVLSADYSQRYETEFVENISFMNGYYSVFLEAFEDGSTIIHSRGTYNNRSTDLAVKVRDSSNIVNSPEDNFFYFAGYSLFSNGDIRFNGTPPGINSSVHANRNWTLNGSYNNISSDILISAANQEDVPEQFRTPHQIVHFPSLSDPEFLDLLENGNVTWYIGDQVFHRDTTIDGIHIIKGHLLLRGNGNHTIDGLLYVTGDIVSNGSGNLELNGIIMAGGNITFNGASGVFDRASQSLEHIPQLSPPVYDYSQARLEVISWYQKR